MLTISQYIKSQPLYRDTYRITRFLPIHSTRVYANEGSLPPLGLYQMDQSEPNAYPCRHNKNSSVS